VKPLLPEVPLPIGFAGTTRWLRALGETLGREREAATLIDEGEKFTVEQCRRQGLEIQFFNRTRVAILADDAMLEAEAKELGTPLPVVPGLDVYGAKRILTDLQPDAVLASNIERHVAAEAGVTYCFRVANPVSRFRLTDRAYFGYTGFLNLMEIIQNDWWDTFRSKKKRWEAKW
jgi:nitrogenase molybdenum-iron protein alpha/beta subunit